MKQNYIGIHEQIGNLDIKSEREKLISPEPEPLEEIYFHTNKIDAEALFHCPNMELTQEELQQQIEKTHNYYRPFLVDHAPRLESTRTSHELKHFQWRIGTEADARDLSIVLQGSGEWTDVELPHFGEPIGLATTYYRTEFDLTPRELEKESQWICFGSVDYKAHVFINGNFIGSHTGFFAPFAFEFTAQAKRGRNTCVVIVENDFTPLNNSREYRGERYNGDKIYAETGVGYDDPLRGWHHCPSGMGIWQDVTIEGRSHLFIDDIFVRPTAPEKAEVWVELYGTQVAKKDVALDISIYGQNFRKTVFEHLTYQPHANFQEDGAPVVTLQMERGINYLKIPVDIPNARIWNPEQPWLYQIQLRLLDADGKLLDTRKRQFGMRFFTMDTDRSPKGVFKLNGKRIKLRGVNSQGREQRMVFLKDYDRLLQDYLLAKVGNINFLRITQRPVQPEVYDLCDKLGLLVQTDFPAFGRMRRNTVPEALKQVQEMEHLIRSHPSCILCSYINEPYPAYMIMPHRCLTRDELEIFFACADNMIHLLNPDRVIKPIDGDYDPPVSYGIPDYHCYTCWYNGHGIDFGLLHKGYWLPVKENWNYGCGEYGMEGMDPVPLMRKYYPKEWLPEKDDDPWDPMNIPGDPPIQVGGLHYYFFETPKTMPEWVEASQIHQASAMNFMTRAYRRNRKMISYAYHLFIDAYPDGWLKAMVDFEGTPKKAFWEYRAASAPVMVDLRYDRFKVTSGESLNLEVWGCNDLDEIISDVKLHYQVYLSDILLMSGKENVTIPASDSQFLGYLPIQTPAVEDRSTIQVQVALIRENGEMLSSYSMDLDVFPKERKFVGKVCLLGAAPSFEEKFRQEFDAIIIPEQSVDEHTAVLIFDSKYFLERQAYWQTLTEKGAKVLLFELPVGQYKIGEYDVNVEKCARRSVHFASRNRNHKITADFKASDVRFWYDEEKGCMTPILCTTLDADGFTEILTSVNKRNGSIGKASVVIEKAAGKGTLRICQLCLQQRIATNPVAKKLLERLIVM